jgi:predicted transcriptional regulator
MYAGRLLAPLGGRCVEVDVDAALAARIFGMNLATWRDDALARGLADAGHLDDVARRLAELADRSVHDRSAHERAGGNSGAGGAAVRWVLRHVVCRP